MDKAIVKQITDRVGHEVAVLFEKVHDAVFPEETAPEAAPEEDAEHEA